ncbi:MAG: hypothetical protein SGARI_001116 [Bacillariaceae sp.]
MRFVTLDLKIEYDYFFALSSSVYPLRQKEELERYLKSSPNRVRIGTFVEHNAKPGTEEKFGVTPKLAAAAQPANLFHSEQTDACQIKTTSGNTAAYPRSVVLKLLQSAPALDVLERSRFSGGCCNEEWVWGLALTLLGETEHAKEPGLVWQSWPCADRRLQNTELTNTTYEMQCVRIDATSHWEPWNDKYFRKDLRQIHGQEAVQEAVKFARDRGILFARKFTSTTSHYWIQWIQDNLWQP